MDYKVYDRLGNEIKIGTKVAWASKHANSAVLKIGEVKEIHFKEYEREDYSYIGGNWQKTGKTTKYCKVTLKVPVRHRWDLNKLYLARFKSTTIIASEENSLKLSLVEVV